MNSRPPIKKILIGILKVILVIAFIAVILLVAAIVLLFTPSPKDIFSKSKFDPKIWFAEQSDYSQSGCYRGKMAFDIRDNILEKGMPKEKVLTILGTPDESRNGEFQYVLGMCSGYRLDYDVLHIEFKNGYLSDADVYQH